MVELVREDAAVEAGAELVSEDEAGEVPDPGPRSSEGEDDETPEVEGEGDEATDSSEEDTDLDQEAGGIFVPENCRWCREDLPNRDNMKFCPFCGSDVRLRPCPECGEELEINWRFCVACGTEVAQ